MTNRITVTSMTPIDATPESVAPLALDDDDVRYMTDPTNSGNMYRFTATGSANVGTVYMDYEHVAYEWGGDPVWLVPTDEANDDDAVALTLALNGELEVS